MILFYQSLGKSGSFHPTIDQRCILFILRQDKRGKSGPFSRQILKNQTLTLGAVI
jgi:hypothetical protein